MPPLFLSEHKAGFFQYSKMLHHGASVERFEPFADIARCKCIVLQEIKYLATAAVRESLVNEIVIFFS